MYVNNYMLVIIGTGLAGYMLVKELRKLGYTRPISMITQDNGDFYSKPQLSTALTMNKTAAALVITPCKDMAASLGVTIYAHTKVLSINRAEKIIACDKHSIHYEQLVLACGALPIRPIIAGDAAADIISVNNLEDYSTFRATIKPDTQRCVIIGTGLVGCEFANDLLQNNYDVDLISLDAQPLARCTPAPIGKRVQQAFTEHGAGWHFKRAIISVNHDTAGAYRVTLDNGEIIFADTVLSAVGLSANTQLASDAGLAVHRGIVVNRQLMTSDPAIFALGDCAEVNGHVKQYVAPLLQSARTLAPILQGDTDARVQYPPMPTVIKIPFCPVATLSPPEGVVGDWEYEAVGSDLKALFYTPDRTLAGFSLTGKATADKAALIKNIPPDF